MFEKELSEIEVRLKNARQIMDDPQKVKMANSGKFKATMTEVQDRKRFYESARQCLNRAFEYVDEDGLRAWIICMEWFDDTFKHMWHVQPKGKSFVDVVWLREIGRDEERMKPLNDAIAVFEDQKAFSDADLLKEKLQTLVAEMVKLVIDVREEYVTK